MNKSEFLKRYRNQMDLKVTVYFNDAVFLNNKNIVINEKFVKIENLRNFYIPRYIKADKFDPRPFEEKIDDPTTKLIKMSQAISNPEKWDLEPRDKPMLKLIDIWPIPIATDLLNRTLILDSNHTVLTIAATYPSDTMVPVVEILGTDMTMIIDDFMTMNRV